MRIFRTSCLKVLFLWLTILLLTQPSLCKKWRALALSGGGDKGSYQASVFIEFTNHLPKAEVSYDVVTGASAGSLNGAGISLFAPGHEKDAATFIYGLWHSIKSSDILKVPDDGILYSLFFKQGIFDNSPLEEFLYKQSKGKTIERKFTVVVTNSETGFSEFIDYNHSDTIPEDAIPTIVGSSAIPFAFPPMKREGKTLIDGGWIWNLDVTGAIRRCKEVVEDEKDIIVDIILCTRYYLEERKNLKNFSALDHYFRAREIEEWQFNMQDVERAVEMYPDVNFRYVIGPSEILSNSPIPLDFSEDHLNKWFEIGQKDAEAALRMGEGGYLSAMMDHYKEYKNGGNRDLRDFINLRLENAPHGESE